MIEIEKRCLNKLLKIKKLKKGIRSIKELHVVEECIAESTLDIWCDKKVPQPKDIQYETYECFILRFELAFSGFINPVVDLFHYTLKDVVRFEKIMEVTEGTIEQCFEKGTWVDKYMSF